jgi:glycosyltransferase involved in cell wall biosynthesis
MRVGLIALGHQGPRCGLATYVDRVAEGLVRRGAKVEIVGLADGQRTDRAGGRWGQRIPSEMRRLRLAVPSASWRALASVAVDFDVVDVHISEPPMVPGLTPFGLGPMVLTLHGPVERLRKWPYAHAVRALIAVSDRIVCASAAERHLLVRAFPHAVGRSDALSPGVDARAIRAAEPFISMHTVILAVGPLVRKRRVDRAIAALPSLDRRFRLVIVGDGPDRRRLEAYAADLRVAARVTFAGANTAALRHRWLSTARVLVALAREDHSGLDVMEALAAGASVVASDIPVHREVVERVGDGVAFFVSPDGSPFDVADAVELADQQRAPVDVASVPSWDSVADATWQSYRRVMLGTSGDGSTEHPRSLAS